MNKLISYPEGLYRIIEMPFLCSTNTRLLEMGFFPGNSLYIICNNILGIQVRIDRVTYLLNEEIASIIYVEPIKNNINRI